MNKHIFFIAIFVTYFSGANFDNKYINIEKNAKELDKRIQNVEHRIEALSIKIDSLGFLKINI